MCPVSRGTETQSFSVPTLILGGAGGADKESKNKYNTYGRSRSGHDITVLYAGSCRMNLDFGDSDYGWIFVVENFI
jgi:hypothetical protein